MDRPKDRPSRGERIIGSNMLTPALKADFGTRINAYLREKGHLNEAERALSEKEVLDHIRRSCVANGISKNIMTRIYNGIRNSGGLEKVIKMDWNEMLKIKHIYGKSASILYEIVNSIRSHEQAEEELLRKEVIRLLAIAMALLRTENQT